MQKVYCSSCGNPVQYSEVRPNFCFKCGTNLSTGKPQILGKIEEKIEVINTRPSIQNLNWDIDIQKPKGVKLKDLAKGQKNTDLQPRDGDNVSKEDFLKQFQKEAGTLRRDHQNSEAFHDSPEDNYEEPEDA